MALDSELSRQRKGVDAFVAFAMSAVCICVGLWVFGSHLIFFFSSTVTDAKIVEVRREYGPKGRGSVMAYVPVVQITNSSEVIKVDTYDEQPVYAIGSSISVRCKLVGVNSYCTDTSIFSLFVGPMAALLIGLVMLAVGFYSKAEINHPTGEILSVVPK